MRKFQEMKLNKYNSTQHFKNTTVFSIPYDRTIELDWILPVTVNIGLTVVTFWIFFSLIHYGIKNKKWRYSKHRSEVLNSGLIYGSVVVCAFSCIVRYVVSLLLMNVGFSEERNDLCDSLADAAYISYAFVLCFVALFLWLRQRSFYSHRLLNVNYSKEIKITSCVVFAFILGYGIFATVLNTHPHDYKGSKIGCIRRIEENQMKNWIAAAVGVAFYNLVLFGLFSYALTHIKAIQKAETIRKLAQARAQEKQQVHQKPLPLGAIIYKHNLNETITESQLDSTLKEDDCKQIPGIRHKREKMSTSNKIKNILQKTLLFATISIVIDVFLQVFANYIANPDSHRRITNMIFDISAFLNLLFVIFSFAAYKQMLFSPCKRYKQFF